MLQTNGSTGQGYHQLTRWLHAGLVLGVIFQLVCAALMAHPDHQDHQDGEQHMPALQHAVAAEMPPMDHIGDSKQGQLLMQAHRTGGILVAVIVLANLIWAFLPRGKPRKRQISVLLSKLHWREALSIARNMPQILLGKRPLPKSDNSLSLVFEMLGLLTMSAMAVTGFIIWILWAGPGNQVTAQAEVVMETHAAIAILLFFYLTGHVSMALMHVRAGDPIFSRILPRLNGKNDD
ncbi:MAG: cytochrome b/b6 domain-containing protein [Mariprofundaceae bacterium]|nr:cytochrome b/b6 domain-containing protein [Mariprofundaceae bacterium]